MAKFEQPFYEIEPDIARSPGHKPNSAPLIEDINPCNTPSKPKAIAELCAKRQLLLISYGRSPNGPMLVHQKCTEKLTEVMKWCDDLSIRIVTIWVLSTDNLRNRPPGEVSSLLAIFEKKLKGIVTSQVIQERKIRIKAVGRLEQLPASTLDAIREAEAATSKFDAFRLNIAVAYGGREEISDAVKSMLKEAVGRGMPLNDLLEHVTPDEIARHLYSVDLPEPDLIIRTSGELRLSGFLLWQSAYSEFYFADVLWPEFRRIDFLRAIRSYQQRGRRFGG